MRRPAGTSIPSALVAATLLVFAACGGGGSPPADDGNGGGGGGGTGEGTFYVATTGDDAGPGTVERPWRTIGHALEEVTPGATIRVRGGVYPESVRVTLRASASAPTVLASVPGRPRSSTGRASSARGTGWW